MKIWWDKCGLWFAYRTWFLRHVWLPSTWWQPLNFYRVNESHTIDIILCWCCFVLRRVKKCSAIPPIEMKCGIHLSLWNQFHEMKYETTLSTTFSLKKIFPSLLPNVPCLEMKNSVHKGPWEFTHGAHLRPCQ